MQFLIAFITFCLILGTAANAQQPEHYDAGILDLEISDSAGRRPLSVSLWYPTHAPGPSMRFGENAVFEGVTAAPGAPLADGPFPLVLVSHGLDGNSLNQAWLARALAEAGFVVAAPNHPGTTTWDRDPEMRSRLAERPRDLSRVIDAAFDHPDVGPAIDRQRIAAIGHSLGGWTVMALIGAAFDAPRHAGYCAGHPDSPDCRFMRDAGIGDHPVHLADLVATDADPRIGAAIILDLAFTQGLAPTSLAGIRVPVLVIGAPRGGVLDLDMESRALAASLPGASVSYAEPDGVSHYDFVGTCKQGGLAILAEDDPEFVTVCSEGSAQRAARHAVVAALVTDFLNATFPNADHLSSE